MANDGIGLFYWPEKTLTCQGKRSAHKNRVHDPFWDLYI